MPSVESQSLRDSTQRRRVRGKADVPDFGDLPTPAARSWWQRLRRDLQSGRWGLFASAALHLAFVSLAAVWIIRTPRRDEGDPILIGWLQPPAAGGTAIAAPREPVRLAVDLGPGAVTVPPVENSRVDADRNGKSVASPVKPAEVAQSLRQRQIRPTESAAGGATDTQAAIRRGLEWLQRAQLDEGRWELHQGYPDAGSPTIRTDTGATALALLCFLGDGHAAEEGQFSDTVNRGLDWLSITQDRNSGDLHDLRYEEGRQPAIYAHALATIVLCEALALSADDRWRGAAERAVDYLLRSQHPDQGGWKYRPIAREANGDLSVTGWALMALHTARMAGIEVPQAEFEKASAFLDSVQESNGSRYKYEPSHPRGRVTPALTAEALLCRQWLGWPKDHPAQVDGVDYLLSDAFRPQWTGGRRNVYAWYYTAQMLHNRGGDDWRNWFLPTRDLIVQHQVKTGNPKVLGSWHPTQPMGMGEEYAEKAGRLYITAMCLLILETPHRHAPIYGDG